jgi:hypothetical protein
VYIYYTEFQIIRRNYMKKIFLLTMMLVLVVTGITAATVDTDTLNFHGQIGAGLVIFEATQDPAVSTGSRIDLINNADVQPAGNGVRIGDWEFTATNQASALDYTVTYSYTPLTQGSGTNIAYELIIADGVNTPDVLVSNDSTQFSATTGNTNVARDVLVRLTTAGVTAASSAPSGTAYDSEILLTLTTP